MIGTNEKLDIGGWIDGEKLNGKIKGDPKVSLPRNTEYRIQRNTYVGEFS